MDLRAVCQGIPSHEGEFWTSRAAMPPPIPLEDFSPGAFYIRRNQSSVSRSYISALLWVSDDENRRSIIGKGLRSFPHFEKDGYYDVLLKGRFDPHRSLPIEDDSGVLGGMAALPALRGQAGRRRKQKGFTQDQSFRIGCVSWKVKHPTQSRPGIWQLQCDCPRRSHRVALTSGRKTLCTFTLPYKTLEEREAIIARQKFWVAECNRFRTKAQHMKWKPPLSEVPACIDFSACLSDRDETDDDALPEEATVPRQPQKRRRARSASPAAVPASGAASSSSKAPPPQGALVGQARSAVRASSSSSSSGSKSESSDSSSS